MTEVIEVTLEYNGYQIDYEETTYYPNGLIDDEEGIPAILVLTDKGGWSVRFNKDLDEEFNLSNVGRYLRQNTFKSIVNHQIDIEDTSGIAGELHLNGVIEYLEEDGTLSITNASDLIANDWRKIGEREPYECVVKSDLPPQLICIALADGTEKNFENPEDAAVFIEGHAN